MRFYEAKRVSVAVDEVVRNTGGGHAETGR